MLSKEKLIELAVQAGFHIYGQTVFAMDYSGDVTDELTEFARLVVAEVEDKPDADGWITWAGGECPVPAYTRVEVRFSDGSLDQVEAWYYSWYHYGDGSDIVAYRVVEEAVTNASDAEGWIWITWSGGKRPVQEDAKVAVLLRNGIPNAGLAGDFDWKHYGVSDDIVSYSVISYGKDKS